MVKIASAGNSETAAFSTLIQKGYSVSVIVKPDRKTGYYVAKQGGHEFIGDSPIETLGLITMYESRGQDWEPTNEEIDRFCEFEEQAFRHEY